MEAGRAAHTRGGAVDVGGEGRGHHVRADGAVFPAGATDAGQVAGRRAWVLRHAAVASLSSVEDGRGLYQAAGHGRLAGCVVGDVCDAWVSVGRVSEIPGVDGC